MSGSTRSDFASVWSLYLWIGIGVAVLVFGAVGFAVVRYRERPGRAPSRRAELNLLEGTVAALILAIVALLVFRTFSTEAKEDDSSAVGAVRIDVDAFQWGWKFTYPGEGVTVVGDSDHEPDFAVPAGRTVSFALTSSDVIHAMWIPGQRFKKDAIPGRTNRFDLEFGTRGREQGLCSEFCGLRHSNMRFGVWILSQASYERWLAAHR
ncbi:MAG TPA: cytochrome c oxidase subunit II [Solirubrobacterales bacterium]|nr:cytochrome c oxidase subunit II [Solirubrobacterales bacterium]